MYWERAEASNRIRLAVVFSAFLLMSSGFTPMMAGSVNISRDLKSADFLVLFSILDPFATVSSTQPAIGNGISAVQPADPVSTSVESASPAVTMSVYSSPSSAIVSLIAIVPGIWDESSKKRSRSQIYVEILELLKRGPLTPFEIAFYARLNHKRCKEYLRLLERSGYLNPHEDDGRTTFSLSENGKVIVEKVRGIFERKDISTRASAPESTR